MAEEGTAELTGGEGFAACTSTTEITSLRASTCCGCSTKYDDLTSSRWPPTTPGRQR